jgi:peroxiredoxin Q/BCP
MAGLLTPWMKAPDFTLPRENGGSIRLRDLKGRKVVLLFYPRADSSGCTREAMAFNRLRRDFERRGTVLLGISADPVAAQKKFANKHGLAFPLLSDESKAVLRAFGVWKKKQLYGRSFMGVERTTFLIDADGRIANIWRKVRVEGHAEQVLTAACSLAEPR